MRTVLLPLILLFALSASVAQDNGARNIFTDDFDYFIGKLQETHPDPYTAYGGRVEFYRAKHAVREELAGETDTLAFVRRVRAFVAKLEDAHTWISNPSSADGTFKYLPLRIGVSMEGLYIQDAGPGREEWKGGRIVEIEGLPVEEIARRRAEMSAAENRYGNYRNIINQLGGDIYAGRLFGYVPDTLGIAIEREGRRMDIKVGYTDSPLPATAGSLFGAKGADGILFTHIFPEAGYLRWNSIQSRELIEASRNSGYSTGFLFDWAFQYLDEERTGDDEADIEKIPYIYSTVAALLRDMVAAGTGNLIIDLRDNSGGMTPLVWGVMRMLYGDGFLTKKFDAVYGVRLSPMLLAKRGYENIEGYNSRNGTDFIEGDISFDDFAPNGNLPLEELQAMEMFNGYGGIGAEFVNDPAHKRPSAVYVLVSPGTFSAAYHFTYMLSEMGAVSVGVVPGQAGNTFMESTRLTLPKTGIEASVSNSWQMFYPDDPARGKELVPDHPMTIDEYRLYGFDPDAEVKKALELIRTR